MEINELLSQKGMSKYRLSKESGVAQTTIMDICSGKARIEKCAGDTLYRIAKALEVSMESLLEERMKEDEHMEHRASFEVFKSNVCHAVKDKGDIDFLIDGIGYEVKTQNCILENKICIELKSNVEKNYNGWFYTTAA